jgi:quercetin dioxygenase-like cupin family protein
MMRRFVSRVKDCDSTQDRNGFGQSVHIPFVPEACNAWHTHPLGQTLIVTYGGGRTRRCGGPIEEIRPGEVVWIPPGEKHRHGTTQGTAMAHIAIQEQLDGKAADWKEQFSDAQHRA